VALTGDKIHIPSHLSRLIDLILIAHSSPTDSVVPIAFASQRNQHAHVSDETIRALRELLYATLRLIEFFSMQPILRTSFRFHRQVLVAVTAMTVGSRLYCVKITELAKRVSGYLRAC
jgi:hypothetical protein